MSATVLVDISGNAHDLVGGDFNASRTKVVLAANTDHIVAADLAIERLGTASLIPAADGTFTFTDVIASTDLVENLQYTVRVDYPVGYPPSRQSATFGPYELTVDADVSELEEVQALDPSYASEFMTQAQALLDAQIVLSGIDDTDSAVAGLIEDDLVGPLTNAAVKGFMLLRGPKSVADFDILPTNTAAQNVAGFAVLDSSGYTDIYVPDGVYDVTLTQGTALATFTGVEHLRIRGNNAVLNDLTTHTNNAGYTTMFLLDGCTDTEITGVGYVGNAIASPTTNHGYRGATFVRAINGTTKTKVDAHLENLRYGVQSGDYADATVGECSGFDLKIRGEMIGYPVALQLASNIHLDIDVDGVHRAYYLAGVNHVRGNVRYKNQYIAPLAGAITNTLHSGTDAAAQIDPVGDATTSLGPSDIRLTIEDAGSTQFVANSAIAGIYLQRVDASVFKDIHLHIVGAKATNSVSTTVGGFVLISGNVPSVWNRYGDEITSDIVFDNITVTGSVDHSGQSVASTNLGEVYVHTEDFTNPASYATVDNITVDMDIKKSTGGTQYPSRFRAPGLVSHAELNLRAPGVDLEVYTNATSEVELRGNVKNLDPRCASGQSRGTSAAGASIDTMTNGTGTRRWATRGGKFAGAGTRRVYVQEPVTLSGASVSSAFAIPAGATLVEVRAQVTTAITGASSGWWLGITGDSNRYTYGQKANAAGITVGPADYADDLFGTVAGSGIIGCPMKYKAATNFLFTASGSNFSGGVVHLYFEYDTSDDLLA